MDPFILGQFVATQDGSGVIIDKDFDSDFGCLYLVRLIANETMQFWFSLEEVRPLTKRCN